MSPLGGWEWAAAVYGLCASPASGRAAASRGPVIAGRSLGDEQTLREGPLAIGPLGGAPVAGPPRELSRLLGRVLVGALGPDGLAGAEAHLEAGQADVH